MNLFTRIKNAIIGFFKGLYSIDTRDDPEEHACEVPVRKILLTDSKKQCAIVEMPLSDGIMKIVGVNQNLYRIRIETDTEKLNIIEFQPKDRTKTPMGVMMQNFEIEVGKFGVRRQDGDKAKKYVRFL